MATSNHTAFGADILRNATLKIESDTGKLMLADKHSSEFADILKRLAMPEAKTRTVLLDAWKATPTGDAFFLEYDELKADGEQRTATQDKQFALMQARLKQINTTMGRALDTYRGIVALRSLGRTVKIEKAKNVKDVENADAYTCYVNYPSDKLSDEQRKLEKDEPVLFDASKLARIEGIKANITDTMATVDVRRLCSPKSGKRNKETNANGHVDHTKVKEQTNSLDTAVSALIKDGKLAGGKGVNEAIGLLYARLERELSSEIKAAGLKAYDAEGVMDEAIAANV